MFAKLGDIEFQLLSSPSALSERTGVEFAEHKILAGKPVLQAVGKKLREFSVFVRFHYQFIDDPGGELEKLREALDAQSAQGYVAGDGEYWGEFVITDIDISYKTMAQAGSILSIDVNITLKEYNEGEDVLIVQKPKIKKSIPRKTDKQIVNMQAEVPGRTELYLGYVE